jgi:hypothetical protein
LASEISQELLKWEGVTGRHRFGGTQFRVHGREMGHIQGDTLVDLDSDPSNILKVVRLGKQLLMTRSTITTFSIANDAFPHMCIFQLYI